MGRGARRSQRAHRTVARTREKFGATGSVHSALYRAERCAASPLRGWCRSGDCPRSSCRGSAFPVRTLPRQARQCRWWAIKASRRPVRTPSLCRATPSRSRRVRWAAPVRQAVVELCRWQRWHRRRPQRDVEPRHRTQSLRGRARGQWVRQRQLCGRRRWRRERGRQGWRPRWTVLLRGGHVELDVPPDRRRRWRQRRSGRRRRRGSRRCGIGGATTNGDGYASGFGGQSAGAGGGGAGSQEASPANGGGGSPAGTASDAGGGGGGGGGAGAGNGGGNNFEGGGGGAGGNSYGADAGVGFGTASNSGNGSVSLTMSAGTIDTTEVGTSTGTTGETQFDVPANASSRDGPRGGDRRSGQPGGAAGLMMETLPISNGSLVTPGGAIDSETNCGGGGGGTGFNGVLGSGSSGTAGARAAMCAPLLKKTLCRSCSALRAAAADKAAVSPV